MPTLLAVGNRIARRPFPLIARAIVGLVAVATFVRPLDAQQYVFSTFVGQNTPAGSVDGPAASARFNAPSGVAVDNAGNIYVADTANFTIRKITPAGVVTTLAGVAGSGGRVDGTGADARFSGLRQLAFDATGNILGVEGSGGALRKISPTGVVTTIAGGTGSDWQDGPVSFAGFLQPNSAVADASGNIFVADTGNNKIRKISPAGTVTTIAGIPFSGPDSVGSADGPGEVARFNHPAGIAIDGAGNLFIADTGNHLIRKMTPDGVVSTYAGDARFPGSLDGDRTRAFFNAPTAIVSDSAGNLFIADTSSHTIRKISAAGVVTTIAGLPGQYGGDDGSGNQARFSSPSALALDGVGNLIVADTDNNAIRKITPAGVVTTIAGRASVGSTDGSADTARFLRPWGLGVDGAGNVYVTDADNSTVRKITPAGIVSTLAGKGGFAGSEDGTGSAARFNNPLGVAVDGSGAVYVADTNNNTIRKISAAGVVTTLAGQASFAGSEDGTGSAAHFRMPHGVAADAAGNVFVADTYNNAIRKITPTGVVTTLAGGTTYGNVDGPAAIARFFLPQAVAVDRSGNIYVADGNPSLRKITPDGMVTTFAGGRSGSSDGAGNAAEFNGVSGLATDAGGNLFVTDSYNSTIRKISPQGEVVTIGGRVKQPGYVEGVGGFARFQFPIGIGIDAVGTVYIADPNNVIIRKATPTTATAPPIITNNFRDQGQNVVAGAPVTFRVAAAGSSPLIYQWYQNQIPIAGATNPALVLPSVTAGDAGEYNVTVRNSAGLEQLFVGALAVYTPALSNFSSRHVVNGGEFLWGIATGAGRLVTVGTQGKILTSTDGTTWTTANSTTTDWLVGVAYGGGQFVAVGNLGRILTSPDGASWTNATHSGTTQRLNNVVYGAGTYVAVGEGGAIVTSTDAKTWTPRDSGVTTWLRGLAYSAQENYFALSGQAGVFRTSTDAITWKSEPQTSVTGDLEATVPVSSYATFASIGQDGLAITAARFYYTIWWQPTSRYYSWTWNNGSAGTNLRLRGLAEGANALFATGENGVILTAPNINGPWATLDSYTNANLVAGVFFGNSLYVVGENETILQSDPLYSSRLINISTRGQVGTGAAVMISGFVVTGSAPKQVLVRAAGPALGPFGVTGVLAAPVLTLHDGASHPIGGNTGWGTATNSAAIATAAARVGAFPFAPNSGDSALLTTLNPGSYTVQVAGQSNTTGISLAEVYDADTLSDNGSRAINISTRGFVGTGQDRLIAGFVINGQAARRVLIRAVGPSLAPFGVAGILAQPQIQLYDNHGVLRQTAGAWSAQINSGEIRSATQIAGAFTLQEDSADAALVTTLVPGSWTVQVSGINNATGIVLVEVYDLP